MDSSHVGRSFAASQCNYPESKNDGLSQYTHTHTHRRNIRITLSVFHLWQKKFKVGKEPHLAPLAVKMTFCYHRNSTMKTRESMSGWTKGEKEKKKTLKTGDCPCHIYTDEEQKQLFILKLINICECVENRREHTHTHKKTKRAENVSCQRSFSVSSSRKEKNLSLGQAGNVIKTGKNKRIYIEYVLKIISSKWVSHRRNRSVCGYRDTDRQIIQQLGQLR